jgi:hypothetical protein
MSARGVLVLGTGKRVRETALPAFARLPQAFRLESLWARRAKELEAAGQRFAVRAAADLDARALDGIDLVYLAVAKDAVPEVLARLARLPVAAVDLLIDTPVVRFKHFRHAAHLRAFRSVWVAEDCVFLPWIEPLCAVLRSGAIGELEGVLFTRSAYAYHGLAMARALLAEGSVKRARRRREGAGSARRHVLFAGGREAWMVEPRDYAVGRLALFGSQGSIADYPMDAPPGGVHLELAPELSGGNVVGVRIGAAVHAFDRDEVALCAGDPPTVGLTARMEAFKRAGFLGLLRSIADGTGGYPLRLGLEDMVVDYWLERVGRYRASALTDPARPLARAALSALTRLVP